MKLKKDEDELMPLAFTPAISMMTDKWANEFGIPKNDLARLASGFTWELETNEQGTMALRAYKTDDMNLWRAWVAIDFEKDIAIVYFANSENGYLLAEQIVLPNVQLEHAPNFFLPKWGFARVLEPDWKNKDTLKAGHTRKSRNDESEQQTLTNSKEKTKSPLVAHSIFSPSRHPASSDEKESEKTWVLRKRGG